MNEVQALSVNVPPEVIHNWGWFLAFGIGILLLGVLAVVRSVAATVASMLFFGCCCSHRASKSRNSSWSASGPDISSTCLAAVLFGVVGVLMIWRPVASSA